MAGREAKSGSGGRRGGASRRPRPPARAAAAEAGSLADAAYARLLDRITTLALKPGDPLAEAPLAATLGMSRTPVREALRRLGAAGLARAVPGRGLVVADLSVLEVEEMLGVLAALDTEAAALAAASPDLRATVIAAASDLEQAAAVRDLDAWREADRRFHAAILDGAGNAFLADLVTGIRRKLHRITISSATRPERILDCAREHGEVARAVASGDPERARAAMREHQARMRASVLALLERFVIPLRGERF